VLGRPLNECKQEYIRKFGLTARQFNAVRVNLGGKVKAGKEGQKVRIASLREAIAATEKAVKKAEKDVRKLEAHPVSPKPKPCVHDALTADKKHRLFFTLHQKKRRLFILKRRLAATEADQKAGRVRICFGGKKLFKAQFHLKANGFADPAAWKEAWRQRRASQFLCLGSKDELFGNQTCTRMSDGSLRLRVPPALEGEYGRHILIKGVEFRYGQAQIDAALARGEAVTYRFVRRDDKAQAPWYIQATVERPDAKITTSALLGALGVDFNPTHVDGGEIDRFGNPVGARSFPVDLAKKSEAQVTAILAEVVADIVDWAKVSGKPLVVEELELDFQKKKAALRGKSPRYARMLSAFSYRKFFQLLFSRAAREGVEVIGVNPAFTSVIGEVKFASGYGLSSHGAAAVAIARRGLKFGERLRSRSAFPLPARNRGKHVWSDWRRVAQRLRAERARGRMPQAGKAEAEGRGRGRPLSSAAPIRAPAGQGPPWDGPAAPGRDTPAQTVGKAVRPACME